MPSEATSSYVAVMTTAMDEPHVHDRSAAAHILDATRRLAPSIAARAPMIEAAGRLPSDVLSDLTAARCFRLLLPESHGGAGADLPTAMSMYQELAEADGSVGWTAMIGGGGWLDLVGLPRATFDELFDGSDVTTAGAFAPTGTATAVEGGYRIEGRWGFASGIDHATWVYANSYEGETDGHPLLRIAVFSRDQVQIEDTWSVVGLCGTGSKHFGVPGVVVPRERTLDALGHERCLDEPIVRVPVPTFFALSVAAVALGIARGALDDVVDLAQGKEPLLGPTMLAANPTFQHSLAMADTELRAACVLIHEAAGEVWSLAVEGVPPGLDQVARYRAAAAWAVDRAAAIVDTAYRAGGGSTIYLDSPLQRRLRDSRAITQHFLVRPDTLTTAGALMAGEPLNMPIF